MFFFSLKKMALKLRYEKKVRGEILGGHEELQNRVLEKRAVWAKVAEDDRCAQWHPGGQCGCPDVKGSLGRKHEVNQLLGEPNYLTVCPSALALLEIYRKISLTSIGTVWPVFCYCIFKHRAVYQNMPFATQGKVTEMQEDKWPLFPLMSEYYL